MSLGNLQVGSATSLTASALVKSGQGALLGFLIVSATTATITVYDNTAGSGTVLMPVTGSLTITTPTWVALPVGFGTGLYFTITGTASVVPVWQ